MFGTTKLHPARGCRYIPRLEILEDRNCPSPVGADPLAADAAADNTNSTSQTNQVSQNSTPQQSDTTTDINQDPARNNIVAQGGPSQSQTSGSQANFDRFQSGTGTNDSTLFGPNGVPNRFNDDALAAFTPRELANAFGTPDNVRRFLLQIDPMTPVPSLPLDQQSPNLALATTNVGNVGPNTLLRATGNRVGGAFLPEDGLVIPWLDSAFLDQESDRPETTVTSSTPTASTGESDQKEATPQEQDDTSRTEESAPEQVAEKQRLQLLPPRENPRDLIGVVFSGAQTSAVWPLSLLPQTTASK